jgi:hypothetical protein
VRTNRPNKAAEARHRKSGPARLGGGNGGGKRALDVGEAESADGQPRDAAPESQEPVIEEDAPSWAQTRIAR